MTSPAIRRLQQDLKQLQEDPIVGANAAPYDDKDLTIWYGLIIGSEGCPLSGIPIRFCLEFCNEYPNKAPKAYFESFIAYSDGATMRDAKGRLEVCLNIFGNFASIHTEWGTESEGWSPSYTVSTILISMQSMMMGNMLSNDLKNIKRMVEAALGFRCNYTGHDGSNQSTWFPQVITDPEVAKTISSKYKKPEQTLLDTFYICYANSQMTGRNSALGYGVHVENPKNGILNSPCEYLSFNSFKTGGVRRSSTNIQFEHFLPILVRNEDWAAGRKIRVGFLLQVDEICKSISFAGSSPQKVFKVCSSLMNSMVVQIMNNGDNSTANDKFINAYFAIYRLLSQISKDKEQLVNLADSQLHRFKTDPRFRVKSQIANLGEFLIYLTISKNLHWSDIAQCFMQECDTRNVLWYLKGTRSQSPSCPELGNMNLPFGQRCEKTFRVTNVSRNLVLFQVKFANVAKLLNMSGLMEVESNFGLAPEELRAELKDLYKKVVAVKDWNEFYRFLELPSKTDSQRGTELENAVKRSKAQGYHF